MSEDTLLDVIVKSLNSDDFKKIDPHGYAHKIGIVPIVIYDALNQAKHEGLIELENNDFTVVKLTPFGERVKNVGGWLEYKFLDNSEQQQIKKPKKPKKEKKPKEVIIVAEENTKPKETKSLWIEKLSWIVGIIAGSIALYEFVIKHLLK